MTPPNLIGEQESEFETSIRFSDNSKEDSNTIVQLIELITEKMQYLSLSRERQSEILYVFIELLNNTRDHADVEEKIASLKISFHKEGILVEYGDSGNFFAQEKTKASLESKTRIASTKTNGAGGAGTEIITRYANELHVDTEKKVLTLLFK